MDGGYGKINRKIRRSDAMMTAKQILIDGLKAMGADGLYNDEGDPFCGCGLDDLAPCEASCEGGISLDGCRPAKREGKYNFYPMEEQYGGGTMSEEAKYGGQCSCGAQIIKKEGGDWHCSKCRSDILERAKAVVGKCHLVRETELLLPELIAEVERLRADQDAIMAAWDKDAVEKDARVQELEAERERLQSNWRQEHATAEIWKEDFRKMKKALQESELLRQAQYNQITANNARIKELEAEVEAKNKQIKELQDIIDKPPEDADWVADYHLLQSALDGPIIDAARKWHAAYRKAQNSNLMRAKEVERLRSPEISGDLKKKIRMIRHCLHNPHSKQQGIDAFNAAGELARLLAAKDARIKELEEMIRQLGSLAFMGDMPLDQIVAHLLHGDNRITTILRCLRRLSWIL